MCKPPPSWDTDRQLTRFALGLNRHHFNDEDAYSQLTCHITIVWLLWNSSARMLSANLWLPGKLCTVRSLCIQSWPGPTDCYLLQNPVMVSTIQTWYCGSPAGRTILQFCFNSIISSAVKCHKCTELKESRSIRLWMPFVRTRPLTDKVTQEHETVGKCDIMLTCNNSNSNLCNALRQVRINNSQSCHFCLGLASLPTDTAANRIQTSPLIVPWRLIQ